MAHLHPVYDSDAHYIIDPINRSMSTTSRKIFLMQNDHDSERFSFEMPKVVEGHDMTQSTSVKIHYINTSSSTREKSTGLYEVDDMAVTGTDSDTIVFTWLLSQNTTKYSGSLSFSIVFECYDENLFVVYRWSTDINNSIAIKKSLNNENTIIELYPDILEQWKQELFTKNYPYEVAVENGFTGTEAEWLLTLKGDSGIWIGGSEPLGPYFWFDTDEATTSIYINAPYDPSDIGDISDQVYNKNEIDAMLVGITLPTTLTGTLSAGQTSITFSDASITTDSIIDIYTDTWGVSPTNVVTSNGSITLTFGIQANNIGVKILVR